jgi:hypothetical protein
MLSSIYFKTFHLLPYFIYIYIYIYIYVCVCVCVCACKFKYIITVLCDLEIFPFLGRFKKKHPETSVTNYESALRKIPEERRSHLHRGGSLRSHVSVLVCMHVKIVSQVKGPQQRLYLTFNGRKKQEMWREYVY